MERIIEKPGVIPRPAKLRNYDYAVAVSKEPLTHLPDKYTIPEKNIPEVHDQTWTQMCVAYSLCQCAEGKDLHDGNESVHYSPSWIYGRDELRDGYEGEGLYAQTAMDGILKVGFLKSLYFDFLKDVPEILTLSQSRDDLLPLSLENCPKAYYEINYALKDKKWNMLRQALVETERPVFIISDTFFKGGSHAIIAIGYADEFKGKKGRFVQFQNSWGTEYKDNGRYYMPFEKVDDIYVLSWEEPKFPFADVKKSDWFYDSVKHAYLSGFVTGTSETDFSPYDNMIRGDMAVILSRMFEKLKQSINAFVRTQLQEGRSVREINFKTPDECTVSFDDVECDDYYYNAIRFMCANGIMTGVTDKEFDPTAAITRAEVATIISRTYMSIVRCLELAFKQKITIPRIQHISFKDVVNGDWFYNYVYDTQTLGLMSGDGDGTFAPNRSITRAEGAAVMCRLFKAIEKLLEQL